MTSLWSGQMVARNPLLAHSHSQVRVQLYRLCEYRSLLQLASRYGSGYVLFTDIELVESEIHNPATTAPDG
jgi:hypothetical protein